MAAMAFVLAHRKKFFRPEAPSVGAMVAQGMFAEVALGMAAPTARICRFPTTSGKTLTMHSRHPAGRLRAEASGQGMVVVVGLTKWRSTSVALTTAAKPPTEAACAPLVVVVETLVTLAAATEAPGVPVTPVRISWKLIAGLDYCLSVQMVGATQVWCTNKDDISLSRRRG